MYGSKKRKNYDDEIFEVDSEREIDSDIPLPMTITPAIVKEVPSGSTSKAHISSYAKAPALSYSKVVTSCEWRVSGRGGSDKNVSNKFTNSVTSHTNGKATGKPKNDNKRHNKFVGRSKNTIVGSRSSNELAGVMRRFHYCVSKLRPSANIESLKSYIKTFLKCDIEEVEVSEIPLKHNTYYRMFKVTVSEKYATEMKDVDNWPSGVEVRRYFFQKRSAECEVVD